MSRILIDLENTRENTFFSGIERSKLMQLTIFLLPLKGIIYVLDGTLKSLNLLEGMCDLKNTIKPPFGLIILIYELIIRKNSNNFVSAQNINIINLFLMELITRKRYTLQQSRWFALLYLHFENFNIFRGLCITQSKIYDRAFIAKIVGR